MYVHEYIVFPYLDTPYQAHVMSYTVVASRKKQRAFVCRALLENRSSDIQRVLAIHSHNSESGLTPPSGLHESHTKALPTALHSV